MKNILIALTAIAFLALVGTVGALEHGNIGFTQCLIQSAISLGVMGVCVYALNRLDD